MGPHKRQLQFEKRLHVGWTCTSLLLTTSDIINFDSLRQTKTTHFEFHLVQGKRSFVSYEWAKFSQTGQTKNWMQKRSCLFAQKTWMKILFQWWPAFIIFIFMILSQTWFQVSFLLFLQRKSRREVWEGCWILGLFWENFSHLKKCSVLLKNGPEIHWNSKTKTSFQCQPNSLSLKDS